MLISFNGKDFSFLFGVGFNSLINNASDNFLFMVFLQYPVPIILWFASTVYQKCPFYIQEKDLCTN